MVDEPIPPKRLRRIVGRRTAVAAIERALTSGQGTWTILEGPPGCGSTTLVEHAHARAAELGHRVGWWPLGRPPEGWAPAGETALVVDDAQELDRAALRAVPDAAVVIATVRAGVPAAPPSALP